MIRSTMLKLVIQYLLNLCALQVLANQFCLNSLKNVAIKILEKAG